jgi:hypothetical protein
LARNHRFGNRPAQNDEQIGSRRRNHIQVVKTDIDIAHFITGFDERGFE